MRESGYVCATPRRVTRAVTPAVKWRYDIHPPTPWFGTPTFPRTPVRPSDSPRRLSPTPLLVCRILSELDAPTRDTDDPWRRRPPAVTLFTLSCHACFCRSTDSRGARRTRVGWTDGGRSCSRTEHFFSPAGETPLYTATPRCLPYVGAPVVTPFRVRATPSAEAWCEIAAAGPRCNGV